MVVVVTKLISNQMAQLIGTLIVTMNVINYVKTVTPDI